MASLVSGENFFVVLVSNKLRGSEEAVSAAARLFAALVLALFCTEEDGRRMRWVAGGLAILGLAHLISGYFEADFLGSPSLEEGLYEGLVTRTLAGILFFIGLVPRKPPQLSGRSLAKVLALLSFAYIFVYEPLDESKWLPPLAYVDSLQEAVEMGSSFAWLTPWHWVLSAVPLVLATMAVLGALRQNRILLLKGWRLFAIVLLFGASLHEYLWPSAYLSGVLTSADLLRLAFAVVIALGSIVELNRIANERATLLAAERERTRRLGELTALKADFSAMVAHELGGPVAALRKLNEMVSLKGANPGIRQYATVAAECEIEALGSLIADVRATSAVERHDFEIEPRPVPLATLVADAASYASTLPGEHPVEVSFDAALEECGRVWADPGRIGQVIRNLLSNAAKYSPAGTPIELRAAMLRPGWLRVEVVDHGPGIRPGDLNRIFEKFERGDVRESKKVAGVGLGLYLSRRIIRCHGSDLTVDTKPAEGSVFGFELEVLL